jgi:hypothetical protein
VTAAPLLERDVDPDPVAALDDADVYHYYHCDPDVGWCGVDLSGVEECPPKPGEVPCPLCQAAWESNLCPVCDAAEVGE